MFLIINLMIHSRSAVKNCPEDEEDTIAISDEQKQKMLNAKQFQIRQLVGK